jgi:cation transport regulator
VPYQSIEDLPASVQAHLPLHGLEIYRSAFNSAWQQYDDREPAQREEIAHRVAWAAVKHKYRKFGDQWIPNE